MKIIPLVKDWIKITAKEILPIVFEAFKKLTIDLIESYKEENFKQLALLKEEANKKKGDTIKHV